MRMFKIIIFLITSYLFYMLGYSNGVNMMEEELREFWGKHYFKGGNYVYVKKD